jgi:CHAT domain-containing protein
VIFALGNEEKALENFQAALQLFRALDDQRTAAYTLANIERRGLLNTSAQRSGETSASVGGGKTNFAHPFFWAPFILIGNWR